MKVKYAVTFEFSVKRPITERGEIEATSVRTCAARAIDEASEKNKGIIWRSISILLERVSEVNEESEDETLNEDETLDKVEENVVE